MQSATAKRPGVGVAVIIFKHGQFLITQRYGAHGAGSWSVPGGHLEFGETWEHCAKREAREEVGVEISDVKLLAVTNDIFATENKHCISIWLTATWAGGEPQIKEPEKMINLMWTDFAHLPGPLFEPCWQNLCAIRPDLFRDHN